MAKANDILARFGGNLAESMGAGRTPGGAVPGAAADAGPDRDKGVSRLRAAAEIAIDRIVSDPDQPRTEFDPEAVSRLAESLMSHGQLQPIAVRWSADLDRYVIVSGERRYRASLEAGRKSMSAVIVEISPEGGKVLELQLIENCLREDLKPVEQARAFRALMDQNGWSAARLAKALSLNDSMVLRALAMLELPGAVQDRVDSGELAPSVAYEVSKIHDAETQAQVVDLVVAGKLKRSEVIEAIRDKVGKAAKAKGRGRGAGPRKMTARTFKASGGMRVTVENRRGLDLPSAAAALREVLVQIEATAGATEAA